MNDMIYADVPKDLNQIKTKLAFGLTKRQIICLGSGALIGVPLYFLTKPPPRIYPRQNSLPLLRKIRR